MTTGSFPLFHACASHSDAIAFEDTTNRITYVELLQRVESRANNLSVKGISAGTRVAWCPNNDLDTLVNFWSLFSIGAVACPISARFPQQKQKAIADRLGAIWLRSEQATAVPRKSASFDAEAPATIILSSGSMGEPKAVVHSLLAHVSNAMGASANMPLEPGDRWMWSLPAYHVSGLAILFRCALAGATVYAADVSQFQQTPLPSGAGVTHLSVVTPQLRRVLRDPQFPHNSLKAVLLGGGAVPRGLVDTARDRGVPLHVSYGLTEMASQVTTSLADTNRIGTSGRLLPKRELKIAESGEILVRGETLCLGYDQAGIIEPVVDEQGWFHTGDLGSIEPNGELNVMGRIDNMFISGGENIHPESIERAFLGLTGIEQVIVIPKDDEEFGARPVAFVQGDWTWCSTWESALRDQLRGFEVPVEFLAWPRELETGIKPNRTRLRKLANHRDP